MMIGRFLPCLFILAFGASASLTLTGCASIIKYSTPVGRFQDIPVTSNPPGASVFVDGEPAGITPLVLRVPRWEPHDVLVELAGYEPRVRRLEHSLNPFMLFNLVFLYGAPFGVGIDFLTGAWNDYLQPQKVHLTLTPHERVSGSPPRPPGPQTTGSNN